MKTADLITSYLNNEMSPDQERQFLISVASSDSLRLALKSHVMLDRIIIGQVQHTHVPEAVRSTIFANASAAVAGGAHRPAPVSPSASAPAAEPYPAPASPFTRFFGRGVLMALLIGGGFTAGYLLHPADAPISAASVQSVGHPAPQNSPVSPSAPQAATRQVSVPQQADAAAGDRTAMAVHQHAGAAVQHSTLTRDSAHKTSASRPADAALGSGKPAVATTTNPASTTVQTSHTSNDAQVDMQVIPQSEPTSSTHKEQGGSGHP
ncbi:MAG TPA: hypothetical protein VHI13_00200 [Candidatus Kapabacteria bacterium]|nr:hypothetical protein [Candidatus Kapabacteria bacterium]